MTPEFLMKLNAKLADFRAWAQEKKFEACRLVQYCGVERIGAIDVARGGIDAQIEGLLRNGYYVAWAEQDGRLYFCASEHPGPEPSWPRVFQ